MRQDKIDSVYAKVKEKTKKPYIKLTPYKKESECLTESKLAGTPYMPLDMDFPRDKNGIPMYLLAQINCQELPPNEIYPDKGIVQFWLAEDGDNYVYGIDFDAPKSQSGWRILYHEEIDESLSLESVKARYSPNYETSPFEVDKEGKVGVFGLSFTNEEDSLSGGMDAFDDIFIALWNETYSEDVIEDLYEDFSDEEYEYLWDLFSNFSSKIGGYANFTQFDPREEGDYPVLLLQLDSEDKCLMWGDVGIANFFIEEADKKKTAFKKVLYNWDCG